jgi:hypothetical protein
MKSFDRVDVAMMDGEILKRSEIKYVKVNVKGRKPVIGLALKLIGQYFKVF